MYEQIFLYPVKGSSALQPVCSRNSNENERIIDFEQAKARFESNKTPGQTFVFAQTGAQAHSPRHAACRALPQLAKDLRTGSLQGTKIRNIHTWKLAAAGGSYAAIAIAALFLAA